MTDQFKCSKCNQIFNSKDALELHQKETKHSGGEKPAGSKGHPATSATTDE